MVTGGSSQEMLETTPVVADKQHERVDVPRQQRVSRRELFRRILSKLCQVDDIKAAFLASSEGLHIASVSPDMSLNQDELAGLVTHLRRLAGLLQKKMKWAPVDEVSIAFGVQHRLVARSVKIGSQELVLIVLVASQSDYYRVTTQALKIIQLAWNSWRGQYGQ